MSFDFASAIRAIKVLPVLAAAMAFIVLSPAHPAGAFGITNVGTVGTGTLHAPVIGPVIYYPPDLVVSASSRIISGDHADPSNTVDELNEYNNNASTLLNTFSPSSC